MDATPLPQELKGELAVAVDDSPYAREALSFAVDLARGLGRPLHVVHVWNFVMSEGPGQDDDAPPSLETWQRHAEQRLAGIVADIAGVELVQHVLHGNAIPTLLGISELARHLVVGSRGRGNVAGMLLGSTSDQLVRRAQCPVTVVRSGTHDA